MRLRIVAALGLLVVGLGAVGVVVLRPGTTTTTPLLTGVASTVDVVEDVAASGTLSASATYALAFGSDPQLVSGTASASGGGGGSSWLVETLTVAVGDQVSAGQALATADTSSASAALVLAQANLTTAEAKLAADVAGLTGAEKTSAYDQVRQAQQSLSQAKSNQANTKAQNDLKLSQAQAALETAQAKLVADQAAGPASSLIEADQAAVTQAQQQLDSLNLQIQASDVQAAATSQQNALMLSQAQATLTAAQAKLAADLAIPAAPSIIDADQAAITQAQGQLDSLNLQIQAANASAAVTAQQNALKLSQAQATLAAAQAKLTADQTAGPAASLIEADTNAVAQAQQQLDTLKLSIEASNQQAANQLTSAQLGLASATNTYATRIVGGTDVQLASDRAALTQAEAAVASAQHTLDLATITAPAAGVVTSVAIQPGALAPSGTAIQIQTSTFQVIASVAESDRPKLAVGQAASITIAATGQATTGRVTSISPVSSSGGQSSVVAYPVTVALDGAAADAAAGMTADVTITIDQATGVVAVPTAAVVTSSSGASTVRVVNAGGTTETRQVEIGLVSRTLTEIRSGVSAGETVVIGTSSSRTGTTTTGGGAGGLGGGGFVPGGEFRP